MQWGATGGSLVPPVSSEFRIAKPRALASEDARQWHPTLSFGIDDAPRVKERAISWWTFIGVRITWRVLSKRAGMLITSGLEIVWIRGMGKSGKRDWGRIRQAFKDALPANPEFNRVDCLNLLMFLAHNPAEGLLIHELELRLPDLGPKVESIVSKLVALGLVKTSLHRGTQLSGKAKDLMSPPPPQEEAEQ